MKEAVDEEDMSSINDIVGDTKVMKALNTEHRVQGRRIDELQTRMEEELESIRKMLEDTLGQIQESQQMMEERASFVERWVEDMGTKATSAVGERSHPLRTWGPPFALLTVAVVVFLFYSQRTFTRAAGLDMVFNRKSNIE